MQQNRLAIALAGLCVLQMGYFGYRYAATAAPAPVGAPFVPVGIGDTLSLVAGIDSAGRPDTVSLRRDSAMPTVVLAFHSNCGFCHEVAPEWQSWLRQDRDAQIVAVTVDSVAAGVEYVRKYDLAVHVISLVNWPRGSTPRNMAARTPAIFVFDSTGTVRWQGHGSELAAVDSVIRILTD